MTLDAQVLLVALGIFALRIFGIALSTVRMLIMVQGRRVLSTLMGFFESLIFVVALGSVVTQLDNLLNMFAYCAGFAVGTYLGMVLEDRLITNFLTVNVVSADKAHEVAEAVRAAGFGATEAVGQGVEGFVGWVRVVVRRREVPHVMEIANRVDASAFITVDQTRAVRHGYWRGVRPER